MVGPNRRRATRGQGLHAQQQFNPGTAYIVGAPTAVYEVHNTGSIWQYTGIPCNLSTNVAPWTMLDVNSLNVQVVYGFCSKSPSKRAGLGQTNANSDVTFSSAQRRTSMRNWKTTILAVVDGLVSRILADKWAQRSGLRTPLPIPPGGRVQKNTRRFPVQEHWRAMPVYRRTMATAHKGRGITAVAFSAVVRNCFRAAGHSRPVPAPVAQRGRR
jgi:hypothetical protein